MLEATPGVVQALVDCDFRAVKVAAGDSVSMALSDEGRVKYWGSFRVSLNYMLMKSPGADYGQCFL